MGIARSSFYEEPIVAHDDTAIVEAIAAIRDEFEAYRPVLAARCRLVDEGRDERPFPSLAI